MQNHLLKIATICWMYCFLATVAIVHAGGDTVARVTDIQGSATEMVNGKARSIRILARLKDGATIELGSGAMITLHFSAKRRDMRFIGPGTIKVKGQSANASNGVVSTKDHDDIGISLDLSDSGLGGIIARGLNVPKPKVNLQHPVKGKIIANRPLVFSWSSGGATATYTVLLQRKGGRVVFNARTTETQVALPSNVKLETGVRYRWTVSTNLGKAEVTQTSSSFEVANTSEASQFYAMSTLTKGSVSDLVLYALQLDEMELKTESDTVWQRLETLRPGIRTSR